MLFAIRGELRVDIREHDDEMIAAADLPEVEKDAVTLHFFNQRTLGISCERRAEREEKQED